MQESIVFLLRVQCRRKESSRSLSHLLMSFLFDIASSISMSTISIETNMRRKLAQCGTNLNNESKDCFFKIRGKKIIGNFVTKRNRPVQNIVGLFQAFPSLSGLRRGSCRTCCIVIKWKATSKVWHNYNLINAVAWNLVLPNSCAFYLKTETPESTFVSLYQYCSCALLTFYE